MANKHSSVAMASVCHVCQLLTLPVGLAVWPPVFAKMWSEGDGEVLEQESYFFFFFTFVVFILLVLLMIVRTGLEEPSLQ